MNKIEFITEIQSRLAELPAEEIQKSIDFYSEMIDDRIEDGMSEEEAVEAIGSVDDAVKEILEQIPLSTVIKSKTKKKGGWKAWEIVMLILGSPIWVPLLILAIVLIFVFYLLIWVFVIVFFAVDLALFLGGIAAVAAGVAGFFHPALTAGGSFALIGVGLILIGGSVMLFIPLMKLAKVTGILAKKIVLWIKSWFVGGKKNA